MSTKAGTLVCARCGYQPEWDIEQWGRHPETHGIGPDPVCPNLIVDSRFPVPDGTPKGQVPMQLCRGTLVPLPTSSGQKGRAA